MSAADVAALGSKFDTAVEKLVATFMAQRGLPSTSAEVRSFAEELHPYIKAAREKMYQTAVQDMGESMSAVGAEVRPARERVYTVDAVEALVSDAVGLGGRRNTVEVKILDETSKTMSAARISPAEITSPSKAVMDTVAARIAASSARHIRAAARQVVADTVEYGKARDASSGSSRELGYARVLTGAENCSFCAMLASRGAVYKKDTVTRRKDGRRYHDNCDCVARLVVRGQPWEGQKEADALYDFYLSTIDYDAGGAVDINGFNEAWQKEKNRQRFSPF